LDGIQWWGSEIYFWAKMKQILTRITWLNFIIFILMWALYGCEGYKTPVESECIPPRANFEFEVIPVGMYPSNENKFPEVAPLGGWTLETALPKEVEGIPNNLIARSNTDIWLTPYEKVLRYNTNTREWKSYAEIDGFHAIPEQIVMTQDRTIWGIGWEGKNNPSDPIPLLSRYNDTNDQFEFVLDQGNLLVDLNYHPDLASPIAKLDNQGVFWMNVKDREGHWFFSFNPNTKQAKWHFNKEITISDFAIAPDGVIWFVDGYEERLFKYDPKSGEIDFLSKGFLPSEPDFGVQGDLRDVGLIYFDQKGNLWIEDRGWVDFSNTKKPVWHEVFRSSVFIHPFRWRLVRPFSIYQSSNGLYWFESAAGMVRLDQKKGEWCLFTTGFSPISEDDQQNLWIVVFGKLYKLHLEP
jgi:hypothetical protein